MTVRDVHVTQWNNLWYLLQTSTPVVKEVFLFTSKQQCVASRWPNLPFYEAVITLCDVSLEIHKNVI